MPDSRPPPELLPFAERTRVLLPGVYAWLLTVELPVLVRGVSAWPRLTALVALAALLVGVLVLARRRRLAQLLGIHAFVACSLLTWALLGSDRSPVHLDRVRTALGALGWALYAFGWGRLRGSLGAQDAAEVIAGQPLVARTHLHPRSLPVAGLCIVAALVFEALAFRVDRPEHAVLAHALAAACAVLVLSTGGRVALAQGSRSELPSGATRLNGIALRGALLSALFGLGLLWAALR